MISLLEDSSLDRVERVIVGRPGRTGWAWSRTVSLGSVSVAVQPLFAFVDVRLHRPPRSVRAVAGGAGPGARAARAQRGAGRRAGRRRRRRCARRRASPSSSATRRRRAPRPSPRPTPATSSAATRHCSATAAPCCSARCATSTASAATSTSRAPGPTPFARGGDGRAAVGSDAAGVRDGRGHARARHPDHAGARRRRHRGADRPRHDAARCRADPGGRQPPARRHVPVRRPARRRRRCWPAWPTTPSPATTRRRPDAEHPYLAFYERVVDAQASLRRPVDARRVHPRRDEHRQHDDLRRDHRLRPVRVHGRLRPGHRLQLDRPRRPLRLREPARRSPSGTWPGWPRRCSRCSATTPSRRWPR